MTEPFAVRLNWVLGALFLIVGLANFGFTFVGGDKMGAVSGVLLTAIGVMFTVGKAALVSPSEVVVKSVAQMTLKTVPIAGFADLEFKGKVLHRRSDGEKILNMGWGTVRASDVERLRAMIDGATP